MTAIPIQLAQEIVDILNGAVLSQAFTAERYYVPKFELREMDVLKVAVMATSLEISTHSRVHYNNSYQIQIGVMKRLEIHGKDNAVIDAALDPMMTLVREILDLFPPGLRIEALAPMTLFDVGNNPIYDAEHFSKWRQFTSVITLTFRSVVKP